MNRKFYLRGLVVALSLATCTAQRQTGAPAGIPVPAVPPAIALPVPSPENPRGLHFRVRLLNGRTGTPIENAHINLWYDEPAGPGYQVTTDPLGFSNMPAPIGEPIRVLAVVSGYADCRRSLRGDPPTGYNLQTIAASGTAAQNGCGQVAVHTAPGELILFVRPSRWYESLNRETGN